LKEERRGKREVQGKREEKGKCRVLQDSPGEGKGKKRGGLCHFELFLGKEEKKKEKEFY